jgi:hypothetical protein
VKIAGMHAVARPVEDFLGAGHRLFNPTAGQSGARFDYLEMLGSQSWFGPLCPNPSHVQGSAGQSGECYGMSEQCSAPGMFRPVDVYHQIAAE